MGGEIGREVKEIVWRECELCDRTARMYCESDDARLCWECDAKVHGANFLVARHTRCLLCRRCQAPTPWRAAGARLGPTVSVCERCASGGKREREEEEDDRDQEEQEEEGEDGEEEEDGDNQVVPWSLTTPPPEASSSSSSEEEEEGESSRICSRFLKRMREHNVDAASQGDLASSSSQTSSLALAPVVASPTPAGTTDGDDNDSSFAKSSRRRSKHRKKAVEHSSEPATDSPGFNIRGLRDHRAVDLVSSSSLSPPI